MGEVLVLGIETATSVGSVAVGSEDGVLASALAARRRQDEFLMPAIDFLFREAGVERRALTGIAADVGPGLFTGLRVGIATAKALAHALALPVVGIPSLDLVAHAARFSPRLICACVDARRGEVFRAFYRAAPEGVTRDGDVEVLGPDALAAEIGARGEKVFLVGDGAVRYGDRLAGAGVELAPAALAHPQASALVELAVARLAGGRGDDRDGLAPLYVRRTDAEINWERRGVSIGRPDRVRIPGRRAADA